MVLATLMLVVLMVALSETPLGREIRRRLAALTLPQLTLGRVFLLLLTIMLVCSAWILAKGEGVVLGLQTLPELTALAASVDLAAYLDVIAVMALLAATVRVRAVWTTVRNIARRSVESAMRTMSACRAKRVRRTRAAPPPPGDGDEPDWNLAYT